MVVLVGGLMDWLNLANLLLKKRVVHCGMLKAIASKVDLKAGDLMRLLTINLQFVGLVNCWLVNGGYIVEWIASTSKCLCLVDDNARWYKVYNSCMSVGFVSWREEKLLWVIAGTACRHQACQYGCFSCPLINLVQERARGRPPQLSSSFFMNWMTCFQWLIEFTHTW